MFLPECFPGPALPRNQLGEALLREGLADDDPQFTDHAEQPELASLDPDTDELQGDRNCPGVSEAPPSPMAVFERISDVGDLPYRSSFRGVSTCPLTRLRDDTRVPNVGEIRLTREISAGKQPRRVPRALKAMLLVPISWRYRRSRALSRLGQKSEKTRRDYQLHGISLTVLSQLTRDHVPVFCPGDTTTNTFEIVTP